MSPIADMNYLTSGMAGIQHLKTLTNDFSNSDKLAEFSEGFSKLHERILQADKQFLLISEDREKEVLLESLATCWSGLSEKSDHANEKFTLPSCREKVNDAWLANTQVNFCGMAFPTVPVGHEDAAALTVLGGFLRNGFLHRAVREQGGAYGGGASQDSGTATFRFYSYRDPRLTATLDDYKHSIDWLLEAKHDPQALEEAILGVISSLDKPSSPAGTARQAFYNELFGRGKEQRAKFRQQILEVSIEQMQSVTEKYLANQEASLGIISNKSQRAELDSLKLSIHQL